MNLTNLQNVETDDLKLSQIEFDDIKAWTILKSVDTLPVENIELNNSIDSMLNRWKVPIGIERDNLKNLCIKLYYARIADGRSRIFWGLLSTNIENILI